MHNLPTTICKLSRARERGNAHEVQRVARLYVTPTARPLVIVGDAAALAYEVKDYATRSNVRQRGTAQKCCAHHHHIEPRRRRDMSSTTPEERDGIRRLMAMDITRRSGRNGDIIGRGRGSLRGKFSSLTGDARSIPSRSTANVHAASRSKFRAWRFKPTSKAVAKATT